MSTGNLGTVAEQCEHNVKLLVSKLFVDGQEPDEPTTTKLVELGAVCGQINTSLSRLALANVYAKAREIWEDVEGAIGRGKAPGKAGGGKSKSPKVGFFAVMESLTGCSRETIRCYLTIAAKIAPDVKERCLGTPLANERALLHRVSTLVAEEQRRIVAHAWDLEEVKRILDEIAPPNSKEPAKEEPAETIRVTVHVDATYNIPAEFKRPVLRIVDVKDEDVTLEVADAVELKEGSTDQSISTSGVEGSKALDAGPTSTSFNSDRIPDTKETETPSATQPIVAPTEAAEEGSLSALDTAKVVHIGPTQQPVPADPDSQVANYCPDDNPSKNLSERDERKTETPAPMDESNWMDHVLGEARDLTPEERDSVLFDLDNAQAVAVERSNAEYPVGQVLFGKYSDLAREAKGLKRAKLKSAMKSSGFDQLTVSELRAGMDVFVVSEDGSNSADCVARGRVEEDAHHPAFGFGLMTPRIGVTTLVRFVPDPKAITVTFWGNREAVQDAAA